MNLWNEFKISKQEKIESNGIVLHFEKGIDAELKNKYIDFARWLRKNYVFPKRIHVYVLDAYMVALKNGNLVYGKFSWFKKRNPIIKIPSRIEEEMFKEFTLDELHLSILSSFVHELTHYFQWIKDLKQSNATSERQANYFRYRILDKYRNDTEKGR
ncbi:MAG: hypothetical protein E7598_02900 [Ruminococcaceae bacterium]|nr:hypothetical protein [Oscillospiraceae bacterium]